MGLVDYSDSESDSEPVTKPAPPPPQPAATPAPAASAPSGKKAFQKVVDRSKPGKILVNLPQSSSLKASEDDKSDEPLAKRARAAAGRGGGAFGGFNALLPPPKNTRNPAPTSSTSSSNKLAPRPGVHLRTSAAPGFSRRPDGDGDGDGDVEASDTAIGNTHSPSIPAEQKPAEEVKLVGKPLMFKPLSVSRKPAKKKKSASSSATPASKAAGASPAAPKSQTNLLHEPSPAGDGASQPPAKKQKLSLFSIPDEPPEETPDHTSPSGSGIYEPMFGGDGEEPAASDDFAAYDAQYAAQSAGGGGADVAPGADADSLDAIAASMNLSAAARRELFGRGGRPEAGGGAVLSFDTEREYAHNERLRASGELDAQAHNPLRAVATGGKHSLRQLVARAQGQRAALEESFARGRTNRQDAGSRYGWR
ncbi:mitotic checkpoint regulator, MAD2B-interacting-domain-containing protein [Durotheca rogersii]|uniref:mitotic checkpoint regulator, MAD2B-interacting-domain-containing protein n=1 Tax=Durotheca rogersii TaxID=419775 RepID=UPI00222072B3|nr:mitotic checkpoint regulator, MAD2B-interacting-domain-containing protein [Durotheca rogersii]KAI5863134.1 mitotic checkpoint regulator, MAD2B-interacting-domain-containing protein [Durotheca rogersii]